MENKQPVEVQEKVTVQTPEILPPETGVALPTMSANITPPPKPDEPPVVDNQKMVKIYEEILQYCRDDRVEADAAYKQFLEMVVNEGDATTSSKEASVQLLRLRHETTGNMIKVMDLLMRVILKGTDTYKPYLNQHQENKVIINAKSNKRSIIEKILDADKKGK